MNSCSYRWLEVAGHQDIFPNSVDGHTGQRVCPCETIQVGTSNGRNSCPSSQDLGSDKKDHLVNDPSLQSHTDDLSTPFNEKVTDRALPQFLDKSREIHPPFLGRENEPRNPLFFQRD